MIKNLHTFYLIPMFAFFSLFIISCEYSTADLADEVKLSIIEEWDKVGIESNIIEGFSLIHKSGNEYIGLLEVKEDGERYQLSVDVTYDGTTFMWEIQDW